MLAGWFEREGGMDVTGDVTGDVTKEVAIKGATEGAVVVVAAITHLEQRSGDGVATLLSGGVVGSGEAGEEGSDGDLGEHGDGCWCFGLLVGMTRGGTQLLNVKSVGVVKNG